MEKRSAPWEVYNNIINQINYSGGTTEHKPMNDKKFISELNAHDYITIEAKNRDNLDQLYILIKEDSRYEKKSGEMKTLISRFNTGKNLIIKYVTKIPFGTMLTSAMIDVMAENPNLWIENHLYRTFLIFIPKHNLVPKQKILSEDEVIKFENKLKTSREFFPDIRSDDVIAVWLGAKKDQIIQANAISETTGKSYAYLRTI